MTKIVTVLSLLLWGALALLVQTEGAFADKRVALVVGNSNYKTSGLNLINPKDDADDVASALRGLGFEVLTETDASLSATNRALQKFSRLATDADTVLFFYAGHALQYQGRNYLMPVDADIRDEVSLPFETIAVENVRAALDRSNGIKIMILDACRNNPVTEKLARLSTPAPAPLPGDVRTRGLERIDKSQGLIVAYATGPDEVALDGKGRNSPFTSALLKYLNEPGIEIEMMFRRIAYDVSAATDGRQRPETYVSLVSEYYINQNDRIAWEQIRNTTDPAAIRAYLAHYPNSYYAIEARYRLIAMQRAIEETKQRALKDAEEKRRAAEQAQREADARSKAEKACLANRAALDAIGPRDLGALQKFLDTNPCDDVKNITQARIAALQTVLAEEAETCHRDGEALVNIAPRDVAAVKALAQRTSCADVKTQAQAKATAIETEIAQEQETCRREDGELKALVKAKDRAELGNLQRRAKCPATSAAVDKAVQDLIAQAEAETCKKEDGELKALVKAGSQAELEGLKQRGKCPATASAADQAIRDLVAAADTACKKDNATLSGLGERDIDGLRGLLSRNPCDVVKTAAQQKLAALETLLAREKEVCLRDEDQWKALSKSTNRSDMQAFRNRVECQPIATAVDQKIADLQSACDRETALLNQIDHHDANALRSFASKATCDDAKAMAQATVARLDEESDHLGKICHRDEALWKDVPKKAADIEALTPKLECPSVIAQAAKSLDDIKVTCGRERTAFDAVKPDDLGGLRALANRSPCDEVKTAAQAKLAALEADNAAHEEICRKEDLELSNLQARGGEARNDLIALQRGLQCERLRSNIEVALQSLDQPSQQKTINDFSSPDLLGRTEGELYRLGEVNTPRLITRAQSELRRLGCLTDGTNGQLDKPTREGLGRYLEARHLSVPGPDGFRITNDFVDTMKGEKAPGCAVASLTPSDATPKADKPEKLAPQAKPKEDRKPKDKPVARQREEERPRRREAERAQPPAREQPRERYQPPPRQYGGGNGGGSGGGNSGGGATMGGVGF